MQSDGVGLEGGKGKWKHERMGVWEGGGQAPCGFHSDMIGCNLTESRCVGGEFLTTMIDSVYLFKEGRGRDWRFCSQET